MAGALLKRQNYAGPMSVLIFSMVNLGAILRGLGPTNACSKTSMLGLAAVCWSGAYIVCAMVYGPILLQPAREDL